MFEIFKSERSLCKELFALSVRKAKSGIKNEEMKAIISEELKIAKLIEKKLSSKDKGILKDIARIISDTKESQLLESLNLLNRSQEKVLLDSLKQDLDNLAKLLQELISCFSRQMAIAQNSYIVHNDLLAKELQTEASVINNLQNLIGHEGSLQKKLSENAVMAKQLEHSDLFKGFMRGVIKVVSYLKFNLLICGQENIPESGPVIIAPRHFHGDYDPILFNTIIRRKAFFLGATDWMKDGVQLTVNKFIFQKFGVVPINRPDSIFEKQNHNLLTAYKTIVNWLMLDQAVIIFPEGYGFIDSHYKKPSADGEFLEVKAGLFHFIDYVQKKKNIRIPIIPIGTMYSNLEHFKNNIVINIGRPIYLPISSGKIDFEPYRQKLQHEIRSLSDLGKELEQAELTLVPQAA